MVQKNKNQTFQVPLYKLWQSRRGEIRYHNTLFALRIFGYGMALLGAIVLPILAVVYDLDLAALVSLIMAGIVMVVSVITEITLDIISHVKNQSGGK
jgi:hypothetical protein